MAKQYGKQKGMRIRGKPAAPMQPEVDRRQDGTLQILLEAHFDAAATGVGAEQFAVELWDLRAAGLPMSGLRRLVAQKLAEHLIETTSRGANRRRYRRTESLAFNEKSCF